MNSLWEDGRRAAEALWAETPQAAEVQDPRQPDFVAGLLDGLHDAAAASPGVLKRIIENAGASAQGLNVEPFQGLVEVLQNADDLGARHLRFALDTRQGQAVMLIVHNGQPVTCHHVLPICLPFLTTKSGDAELRGRWGIGLKTLRRIADSISVHSAPYHFSPKGLLVETVDPEPAIPGFYDPATDTLLRLDLVADFDRQALAKWFADWRNDELLFSNTVQEFSWIDLETGVSDSRALSPSPWRPMASPDPEVLLSSRRIKAGDGAWTIYRAVVPTDPAIQRSNKATGTTTAISFALADHAHPTGVFIGFRTRLATSLPFSLDAQFDPSTAREVIVDDPWNRWLVERCGTALTILLEALYATAPVQAWRWTPLPSEHVGDGQDQFPGEVFSRVLGEARTALGDRLRLQLGDQSLSLSQLAYEDKGLEGLLEAEDIERLAPGCRALPVLVRDRRHRWRSVLRSLLGPRLVDAKALADGLSSGVFADKPVAWWVSANARLVVAPELGEDLLDRPLWLSDEEHPVACPSAGSDRPLLIGEAPSLFAQRWKLIDRLHRAYHLSTEGETVRSWLAKTGATVTIADAQIDLAAFADRFAGTPQALDDADLIALRDRFDEVNDRDAALLGSRVGAVIRLDGFSWKAGKRVETSVSPAEAYLPKTLDGEHAHWPLAASETAGLTWLAASYDVRLKTMATRTMRRRADGTISRGPRKFLLLLGAASAPRLIKTAQSYANDGARGVELRDRGAHYVEHDYVSPDLARVLASLQKASKKDRKVRSPALARTLSRYWDSFVDHRTVPARKTKRVYSYDAGRVTATWLLQLRQTPWIAIGAGDLALPKVAVVRSSQTQAIYEAGAFAAGLALDEIHLGFAAAIDLIVDVRASHLLDLLASLKAEGGEVDTQRIHGIYRSLARLRTGTNSYQWKVGDLEPATLRRRFESQALVWVGGEGEPGQWRSPSALFVGRDIFHDPTRFAPAGGAYQHLWELLSLRAPDVGDCVAELRRLAGAPYDAATEAVLIDVYRYLETRVDIGDRGLRDRFRTVPVNVSGRWLRSRPVFHIQDRELRRKLSEAYPDLPLWSPPCDTHALPAIRKALGIVEVSPSITPRSGERAADQGDQLREQFRNAVDHLSNELARNEPAIREKLSVSWDALRETQLFVYDEAFEVDVRDPELSAKPLRIRMGAVLQTTPLRLHVSHEALKQRESAGRAIATLFPRDVQHRIEAEWVASWIASPAPAQRIKVASDAEHNAALAEQAAQVTVAPSAKVAIKPTAARAAPKVVTRQLKTFQGGVSSVTVQAGRPPAAATPTGSRPLATAPPPPSPSWTSASVVEVTAYSTADLEQRGWDVLTHVLTSSQQAELVDFRRRHRVGADGAIDWRKFVELKATGRASQTSVGFTPAEFERACKEGVNYVLALVSGLEEGRSTEVRLIFDPVNRATVKPSGSVQVVGLAEAPAVVITLADLATETEVA
jgi:hypothetical protein